MGRLVRAPLRLISPKMIVPILQGPLRGKKWIVGSSNHGCWFGTYEMQMQRAFSCAVKPGSVVYDIGANVGFYSLLASIRVGSSGRVYCFEPLRQNVADLRRHIDMNGIKNCEVIEAAVARTDGIDRFDSSRPRSMGQLSQLGTEIARTVRLDTMLTNKTTLPPNVLKIDVEGGELGVLEGGVQMIATYAPIVFLATHGPEAHDQCIEFLLERNYTIQSLNSFPVASSDELLAFHGSSLQAIAGSFQGAEDLAWRVKNG